MSEEATRLDKWLWYARFFKTRSRATVACAQSGVRVNGVRTTKAHHLVRCSDVLTFPIGPQVRVVRIVALGSHRGPATEARLLYENLAPAPATDPVTPPLAATPPLRPPGSGRPTKAERRATERLRRED